MVELGSMWSCDSTEGRDWLKDFNCNVEIRGTVEFGTVWSCDSMEGTDWLEDVEICLSVSGGIDSTSFKSQSGSEPTVSQSPSFPAIVSDRT